MPLTSVPLMALAFLSTAAVVVATVWVWGRSERLRFPLRVLSLLLVEVSLLVSAGLVVNRQEGFYPTWDSLVASDSGGTAAPAYHAVAGSLDQQLAARPGAGGGDPQALPWRPGGWVRWRLAAVPTLVVPAGYLRHPQWHYSVIVVLADAASARPAAGPAVAALRLAANAGQDVVALLTTTPATTVRTLTTEMPARLSRDLRVTGHRWAVVTAPADAPLARRAVVAAPAQYPAVATVRGARPSGHAPADVVVRAGGGAMAGDLGLPPGIATFTSRSDAVAVGWAAAQTPPPLAASSPPIRYLPVPGPYPRPSAGPTSVPRSPTGKEKRYGPGRPRH